MNAFLFPVALLGCLSIYDDQWHGPSDDMVLPSASKSSLMKSLRASPTLLDSDFVDVLVLADASGSAQSIFDNTNASHSSSEPSRQRRLQETADASYSLAIFVDKSVNTLGELSDFCFRPIMTGASSTQDFAAFFAEYTPNGGWDWPENQYGALVAAIKSPNTFPWMSGYAAPLVVLVTDSVPHFEGDSYQSLYPDLAPWGNTYDETIADEYCTGRYYPSAETVRDALLAAGARLGQIISDPTAYNRRALAAAQWLNGFIGQADDYVIAHEDNTDFHADVQKLLDIFRQELAGSTAAPDTQLETQLGTQLETSNPTEDTERVASEETTINDTVL